jgi:phosphatidylserine/phosphatidylglycerophosphate/cardiolipin synthase-like enzyme
MEKLVAHFKNYFGQPFAPEIDIEMITKIKGLSLVERDELKSHLFHQARILDQEHDGGKVISWLEFCLSQIEKFTFRFHKVYFNPGTDILDTMAGMLEQAWKSIDLCVFTITDDRLVEAILKAWKKGVLIRIISDDRKTFDSGSAIFGLHQAGIPVKIDHSQYHMHHKFGVIDGRICFTGSFNWTYTATKHNQENLLVTSKYDLVKQYSEEFDNLWAQFYVI